MPRNARPSPSKTIKQPTLQDRIAASAASVDAMREPKRSADEGVDLHAALLEQFEQALGGISDTDLGHEDRALLSEHFKKAAAEIVESGGSEAQPARSDWEETVQLLRDGGVVGEDDINPLIRQLTAALEPLQRPEVALAAEFSARCERDGQEKALEWFRAQSSKKAQTTLPGSESGHDKDRPRESGAIINSRSRRLRGPPKT